MFAKVRNIIIAADFNIGIGSDWSNKLQLQRFFKQPADTVPDIQIPGQT